MAHLPETLSPLSGLIAGALTNGASKQDLGIRIESCLTHGDYTATGTRYMGRREIWTGCAFCAAERTLRERQSEAERLATATRARMESMIDDAAIPLRFIGRSLANFRAETKEQKQALMVSQDYARTFAANLRSGKGLIFSGLPGTGKSHLATAILQAIMPEHNGLYITCMGVIRAVRGTWRKDSEKSESQVLNALGGADLLVLDEIGVQYGTDGEQTILFDVLDRRYRDMRPTILLTNQGMDGFKSFVGDRSYDRLTETNRWVAFDWGSYRPQARKETV